MKYFFVFTFLTSLAYAGPSTKVQGELLSYSNNDFRLRVGNRVTRLDIKYLDVPTRDELHMKLNKTLTFPMDSKTLLSLEWKPYRP